MDDDGPETLDELLKRHDQDASVEGEEEEEETEVVAVPSSDQEGGSDSDGDGGIDEEGMVRLLKALGDDGLDEFDIAQIESLNGLDEDDEESEHSGEEASGDEESDEESVDGEDEDAEIASAHESEAEEIAIDEADLSLDEDAVPSRKVEIDNKVALDRIRSTIALDPSLPWTETLVVTYPHTIDVDVNDDLNREVAFYKQALHCANEARSLALKHKLPFTRPADYFAEMVKSDSHMERIRQRLLNETAAIKLSEDKKKQREGKKYGKQVQVEKLKERERSKKEMEERIQGLKRKRKDMMTTDGESGNAGGDDDFDVAIENAISDKPSSGPNKRAKTSRDGERAKVSRATRDKKYGFGHGADRRSKQNTRESTNSFGPGAGRGGKGGKGGFGKGEAGKGGPGKGKRSSAGKQQRPGKSKRMNSHGK